MNSMHARPATDVMDAVDAIIPRGTGSNPLAGSLVSAEPTTDQQSRSRVQDSDRHWLAVGRVPIVQSDSADWLASLGK